MPRRGQSSKVIILRTEFVPALTANVIIMLIYDISRTARLARDLDAQVRTRILHRCDGKPGRACQRSGELLLVMYLPKPYSLSYCSRPTTRIVSHSRRLKVINKLTVAPPSLELVEAYMTEIAKAYSVDWAPPRSSNQEPEGGDKVGAFNHTSIAKWLIGSLVRLPRTRCLPPISQPR